MTYLKTLLPSNIPNLKYIGDNTHLLLYDFLKNIKIDHLNSLLFIYNTNIKELDIIKYDNNTIKKLNNEGLHIILYEPLCYKSEDQQIHNCGFYSDMPFKKNDKFISDELESIKKHVIENNLTNVYIHTEDYNVKTYFDNYSPWMKLRCNGIFQRSINFSDTKFSKIEKFDKKFISTNWRYTRHRHLITSYLTNFDSNLSWFFTSNVSNFKKEMWFNIDNWITEQPDKFLKLQRGFKYINKNSPLCLDIIRNEPKESIGMSEYPLIDGKRDDLSPAAINDRDNPLEIYYKNSFCEVVCETRFAQPTGNFSEKTIRPMHFHRPFVLVAPPHTLKYLKEFGFKTFSNFWDESYDDEMNHEKRLIKIFDVINYIDSFSYEELSNLYKKMLYVLDHNLLLVKEQKIKNLPITY
jgi:hypothetical protein